MDTISNTNNTTVLSKTDSNLILQFDDNTQMLCPFWIAMKSKTIKDLVDNCGDIDTNNIIPAPNGNALFFKIVIDFHTDMSLLFLDTNQELTKDERLYILRLILQNHNIIYNQNLIVHITKIADFFCFDILLKTLCSQIAKMLYSTNLSSQ